MYGLNVSEFLSIYKTGIAAAYPVGRTLPKLKSL